VVTIFNQVHKVNCSKYKLYPYVSYSVISGYVGQNYKNYVTNQYQFVRQNLKRYRDYQALTVQ